MPLLKSPSRAAESPPTPIFPESQVKHVGNGRFCASEIPAVALSIRDQYLADLAAMDPDEVCFFVGMGEVIARRLHGTA